MLWHSVVSCGVVLPLSHLQKIWALLLPDSSTLYVAAMVLVMVCRELLWLVAYLYYLLDVETVRQLSCVSLHILYSCKTFYVGV